MRRTFLIALGAGLVIILVALLGLGLFPPRPTTHVVEKTMSASSLAAPGAGTAAPATAAPATAASVPPPAAPASGAPGNGAH